MPNSNKYHSDIESHADAQGFDSENISNPVSYQTNQKHLAVDYWTFAD